MTFADAAYRKNHQKRSGPTCGGTADKTTSATNTEILAKSLPNGAAIKAVETIHWSNLLVSTCLAKTV